MCAVLLDTKGPEIRTGTLKVRCLSTVGRCELRAQLLAAIRPTPSARPPSSQNGKSVTYKQGSEVTLHTDYNVVGDDENIALSYQALAQHVRAGATPPSHTHPQIKVRRKLRVSESPCMHAVVLYAS